MLARPTTEQILLDVRAELLSTIDAAVTEPAVKVAIQMMENVLRNCAERAAHEIAWMRDETAAMVEYAEQVSASPSGSAELRDALASFTAGRSDSLHLDDVTATYSLAGECLSTALEAVLAAGDDVLHVAGRQLLEQRLAHEQQIMGEWTMVGRA
jgi:hypothetical protein